MKAATSLGVLVPRYQITQHFNTPEDYNLKIYHATERERAHIYLMMLSIVYNNNVKWLDDQWAMNRKGCGKEQL
jgi:hypothetical protein